MWGFPTHQPLTPHGAAEPHMFAQLGVLAEEGAADDVDVGVFLALHGFVAEVGEEAEAVGAVLLAHLDCDFANAAQVSPEFGLGEVLFRDREEHYRHPAESIAEDDDLVVLEEDLGGLAVGDDLTEGAGVGHRRS